MESSCRSNSELASKHLPRIMGVAFLNSQEAPSPCVNVKVHGHGRNSRGTITGPNIEGKASCQPASFTQDFDPSKERCHYTPSPNSCLRGKGTLQFLGTPTPRVSSPDLRSPRELLLAAVAMIPRAPPIPNTLDDEPRGAPTPRRRTEPDGSNAPVRSHQVAREEGWMTEADHPGFVKS